jgi:AcrR family transcriptional regulator
MTPRSPESNEAIRAESRARILEHALALFAELGYERTTVRAIAERAGISQGLLYNYFRGKDDLLYAIFEQSMRDVRESFALAEEAPAGRRTEALVRAAFEVLGRNERFWRLSYGLRMQAPLLTGLGEGLHRWTAEVRATLERYLREDGFERPELEATILFAHIDGIAQHYVLEPERYPLGEVIEALVQRYTAGERNVPAEPGPRRPARGG